MSDPASRRRWVPPAVWAAVVVISTSWPNPGVPDVGDGDKVVHLLAYALLAWLIGRALPPLARAPRRLAAVLIALVLFAALDEWHQSFIPGRSASVADWCADVAGIVLGLMTAALRRSPARAASAP
ncbi:MAG: VanZ family protein [Gemmatirosa sp.]